MNEAVLVIMMFLTNPITGDPMHLKVATEAFSTMEECNEVGRNFREIYYQKTGERIDPKIKTISYCVSYEEFNRPV